MSALRRVGVVGCGLMGSGIAEAAARAGCDVVVREIDDGALDAGRARVEGSLARAVERNKLADDERDAALARITFTTRISDLFDRELVVEAVAERYEVKAELFAELDDVVERDGVLASNTSSIPIARIASATRRPGSVLGMHFFNPVPVLPLVELVASVLTEDEVVRRVETFATEVLHKRVIRSPDRAGFIVNALLIPYLLDAVRMVEAGVASAADVDAGMELGCAQPMGPLRLADFIGLDTVEAIAASLLEEFAEPRYACPPLLRRMVSAGLLGKKSGRGFYDY